VFAASLPNSLEANGLAPAINFIRCCQQFLFFG